MILLLAAGSAVAQDDKVKKQAEFRKASQSAKDPDLKAWAGKTLPIIEEHLKMAQDLNKQLSASR